jgi:ABC-type branched-subunit amino acid transport system substrate-binding protein
MLRRVQKILARVLICICILIVCGTPSLVAGAEKTIKIGVIGPMKFEAGKHNWWGATMAADEINGNGGIKIGNDTYKIELVKADSNEILSMSDAVTAMERLLTVDKVNFVTGGYLTELTAIKEAGAQIIGTFLSGPTGVVFSKQWGELRIPAVPIGFNVGAYEKVYWERTGGMCEYETLYHMFSRAAITQKSIPFFDKFVERTGEYPGTQAGTYSIIYILKEAAERAKTLETEAMVAALEKTDHIGPSGRYAFFPKDHKWPHDLIWAPYHYVMVGVQWQDKKLVTVWPDGQPFLGDKRWKGVRFQGTKDFKLPPWMVEYWKAKKAR